MTSESAINMLIKRAIHLIISVLIDSVIIILKETLFQLDKDLNISSIITNYIDLLIYNLDKIVITKELILLQNIFTIIIKEMFTRTNYNINLKLFQINIDYLIDYMIINNGRNIILI